MLPDLCSLRFLIAATLGTLTGPLRWFILQLAGATHSLTPCLGSLFNLGFGPESPLFSWKVANRNIRGLGDLVIH